MKKDNERKEYGIICEVVVAHVVCEDVDSVKKNMAAK